MSAMGIGLGFEPSDRSLGEDRFAERHRQPAVVHWIGPLVPALVTAHGVFLNGAPLRGNLTPEVR
jgi:hypothetical protein